MSYSAGGSTDLVARSIAQKMQERFGQPVVVLNKPGASGTVGATYAAHAAPDGYTLFVGFTSEMVVVPQVSKNASNIRSTISSRSPSPASFRSS